MQTITSVSNERIKALAALSQRKARLAAGQYLVEGEKMVGEALESAQVSCLIVQADRQELFAPIIARANAAEILLLAPHVLEKLSATKTPQGIMAVVALPEPCKAEALGERIVVLDGLQDPGNVGTILRTAEAAGVQGVVLSEDCADVFAPKTLRATMGSVFRMPMLRSGAVQPILADLRGRGWAILASELEGEPFEQTAAVLKAPWALIIGSEAHGVSEPLRAQATHHVRLPMRGNGESLNAAVAAGIMLYGLLWGEAGSLHS